MATICPITDEKCPYNMTLNNDICEDELTCPIVDTSFRKIKHRKRSNNRKFKFKTLIYIITFLCACCLIYLSFFTNIFNPKESSVSPTNPTPTIASTSILETTKTTEEPLVLVNNYITTNTTETISTLEEIKITENAPLAPRRINIDSISIYAEIVNVPLNKYNLIETFSSKDIVSWYENSALPGETGNCILSGNKYFNNFTAVFNDLDQLVIGDLIIFTLDNGTKITQEIFDIILIEGSILPKSILALESESPLTTIISKTGSINKDTGDFERFIIILAK